MSDPVRVVVGRVGRAHGVRGEVGVDVRSDEPDRRFAPGSALVVDGSGRTLVVRSARPHAGRLLVVFEGVDDRTRAEELRGSVLTVDVEPADRPDDPEEFYDHQLVGLAVRTPRGELAGTVTEVLHLPAQDTLSVRTEAGGEVLVPFVSALVPDVDVDAGFVVVDDVPGLLDPQAAEPATDEG